MFANDLMTNMVITVGPNMSLNEIAKLLIKRRISAVPVVDKDEKLLGIVSEGDLVHRIRGDQELPRSWWLSLIGDPNDIPKEFIRTHGKVAKDVMTKEVITATRFTSISELAELLETKKIKRVPIVEAGKLIGIVSRANIIQALVASDPAELPIVTPSDQEIRKTVLEECYQHKWASDATMNVVVKNGVVQFWGLVSSEDAKDALRIAAENIPGVKEVKENLDVYTGI